MYKRGTIVLIPFPFTDLLATKIRPALIISDGKIGNNIVVLFITSQLKSKEKHLVAIKPDENNGLKSTSNIVCYKLATLDIKIALGEVGTLDENDQRKVYSELRKVIGL